MRRLLINVRKKDVTAQDGITQTETLVVVPVGRGLSARPTFQNSSSLPTEIIEMDRDGLGGGGERGDA